MDKVFIDTDVILDFYFDRRPFSDDAAKVFTLCELNVIEGFVTPVIISNVYYLLRQTAKHEKVISQLRKLLGILEVLDINKEVIITSLNSSFKDFEDALQNYAAETAGNINLILTRNTKDYKKSNLAVLTPESYLKMFSSEQTVQV